MKEVYLVIDTNKGKILIPFKKIKNLDLFTVRFNNGGELVDTLFDILEVPLDIDDVNNVSVVYRHKVPRQDTYKIKQIPVKYREDNFNIESLKSAFIRYLKQDPQRIKTCTIKHVSNRHIMEFLKSNRITDEGIEETVNAFFKKDSYKEYRDIYFLMKKYMKIKIDNIDECLNKEIGNNDLSNSESRNDDYFQYLIELASRGDDEWDMAMEELSKSSLEEISRALKDNGHGIFEGLGKVSTNYGKLLEQLTGLKIDKLKELVPSMRRKKRQ